MADVQADLDRIVSGTRPRGARGDAGGPRRNRRLQVALAGGGLLAGLLAAAWIGLGGRSNDLSPTHLFVQSPTVAACTRDGRITWTVEVNGEVTKAELAALIPGQPKCTIIGIRSGKDTGKVLVYDAKGQLVWEKQTAEPYPYHTGAVNQMRVLDLFVSDLRQNGKPEIVVVATDAGWAPSRIMILDATGAVRASYWHPGHLQRAMAFRPSAGGQLRILAWGCNNDLQATIPGSLPGVYYSALVCLDPDTMRTLREGWSGSPAAE